MTLRVLVIQVPYYFVDLERDSDLENHPYDTTDICYNAILTYGGVCSCSGTSTFPIVTMKVTSCLHARLSQCIVAVGPSLL